MASFWSAFAQAPIFSSAEVQEARVYYNGAELQQTATLQLPKGTSEIVLTNIANQIDQNTLQIGSTSGLTILSSQFSNKYLKEYENINDPTLRTLKETVQKKETELNHLASLIETDQQTIKFLDSNSKSGEKPIHLNSTSEAVNWIAFYRKKRTELKDNIHSKTQALAALKKEIEQLKARMGADADTLADKGKGKLIMQIHTTAQTTATLNLNYITPAAHWVPSYDLKIEQINTPIQVEHKAEIVQNSGVDWKNVHLDLTSGKIGQYHQVPTWNTWFIGYQSEANKRPLYSLQARAMTSEERIPQTDNISAYTTLEENQLNQNFSIALPYTILSNGKKHIVKLSKSELHAVYQYYAAPKLDLSVYLIAQIKDSLYRQLLPGDATLIFEGTHVGKTFINPSSTTDNLQLNIGRDPRIAVTRELIRNQSGTKLLSGKKEQNYQYEIAIKNNKNEPVHLIVEDQFPISSDKSIEIVLTQTDQAEVDREKGKLRWGKDIAPGKKTSLRFGYRIRSDKDKKIMELE